MSKTVTISMPALDDISADRLEDKLNSYVGKEITVHNNVMLCSLAEYCHKELEAVFNVGRESWIDPDEDTLGRIKSLIEKCPSGALSYSINGQPQSSVDREPTITIEKNGPLRILPVALNSRTPTGAKAHHKHYALCRFEEQTVL